MNKKKKFQIYKKELNELKNLKTETNELNDLKKDIIELNNFKKEVSFLFRNYITNLDSIILDNIIQNSKNSINPKENIKANLLYRLSRDGPEISTFHKFCDNKGATLTLIHAKKYWR